MNGQVLGIYGDMFTKSHNEFDSSLSAELREERYQCVYHAKLWRITVSVSIYSKLDCVHMGC